MRSVMRRSLIFYCFHLFAFHPCAQITKPDKDTLDQATQAGDWKVYFSKLRVLGDSAILKAHPKLLLKSIEPYFTIQKKQNDAGFRLILRKAYTHHANKYKKLGDFHSALHWYLKAHEMVDDKFCLDDWAWYVENEILNIYTRFDDFEKAEYFGKLTENSLKYYKNDLKLARLCSNLSILYVSRKDITTAKSYLKKGLTLSKMLKNYYGIIICADGLGKIYLDSSQFIYAEEMFILAMSSTERLDTSDPLFNERRHQVYWSLANLFVAKRDSIKAVEAFEKSLFYMRHAYLDTNRREFAKIYIDLSNFYKIYNDLKSCQIYIQKGIEALLPGSNNSNKIPVAGELFHENTLTDLFLLNSEVFYKLYSNFGKVVDLKNAINYLDLALIVNDKIRSSLLATPSKLININLNKKLIDRGIQYLWQLYQLENSDYVILQARNYFDYSKALLLNEKEGDIELQAKLTKQEKDRIKELEREELQLRNHEFSRLSSDSIKLELYRIKVETESIISGYRKSPTVKVYPENYIEYNMQDSFIYVLAKLNEKSVFSKIGSVNQLKKIYDELNKQLAWDSCNTNVYKSAFNFLLGFITENVPEEITIIPDGLIQFIPFEILMDKSEKFLIYSTVISYSFSYGIPLQNPDYTTKPNYLFAIKPDYPNLPNEMISKSRGNISSLIYTNEEIKALMNLYGNNMIIDPGIDKLAILNKMNSARIVHFAGHAMSKGDSAYLILANGESYITIDDIRSTSNPLQMVVLSACETGLGEWEFGEGIRSLGKSFMESGAESVLMSLWAVNDQATTLIMNSYYRYLIKGLPKDISLRNAKLEYIQNASLDRKHPYYWAGFILLGDASSLITSQAPVFMIYTIGALILFMVLFFLYKNYL